MAGQNGLRSGVGHIAVWDRKEHGQHRAKCFSMTWQITGGLIQSSHSLFGDWQKNVSDFLWLPIRPFPVCVKFWLAGDIGRCCNWLAELSVSNSVPQQHKLSLNSQTKHNCVRFKYQINPLKGYTLSWQSRGGSILGPLVFLTTQNLIPLEITNL